MAGQQIEMGVSPMGLPMMKITENSKVEEGDEWALFRLTDDGLDFYKEGGDLAAGIMSLQISGKLAVKEIQRYGRERDAHEARALLTKEERGRTLIRSVRPKK